MAGGNVNSPEYKTISALTNDLNLAVRSNLISVGGSLVSCVLIRPDDYDNLRNRMHPESDRAANLVTLVLRKIQEDPRNYHKFIGVLEQDRMHYEHILLKLKHQYEFQRSNQQLEGVFHNIIVKIMFRICISTQKLVSCWLFKCFSVMHMWF